MAEARAAAADPPVLLGGAAGPTLFAHIAEFGDGWIPIGGAGLAGAMDDLRAAADTAGRDPNELTVVPFGTIPDAGKLEHYARPRSVRDRVASPLGGP